MNKSWVGHLPGCPTFVWQKVALLAAIAAFCLPAFVSVNSLQLKSVTQDRLLLIRIVEPGATFSLSYMHSSELSPVTDFFRVDADCVMVLFRTRFQSSNTGLPSCREESEVLRRDELGFVLDNRDIKMHSFDFWSEAKYSNKLALAEAVYDIPALTGTSSGRSLVRLGVYRTSLGRLLWDFLRA